MIALSPRIQYAALPYRLTGKQAQVLLVTSRETRRWIIPKGWAKKGVKPRKMAALEAFEEAGVLGKVRKSPCGSYRYQKRLADGRSIECEVVVFLMEVERELEEWPERHERERRWLNPGQAARTISDSGLTAMLLELAGAPN